MSLPQPSNGNEFHVGDVAGIPIRFSPWWLLLVLLVFWRTQSIQIGTIVLFCITLSVLLHELGHGLAAKQYGLRPAIVIHAFGGWCERAHLSDRRRNMRIVAAGPGVSLGLAALFWVVSAALPAGTPRYVLIAADYMAFTNLLWGIFNLLPVLPMDGGRLLQLQLGYHVPANRADGMAYWIGAITAVFAAIGTFVYFNSFLMPVFLAVMAWQNAQKTAFHPFKTTFRSGGRGGVRGSSGFELPPIVAAFFGIVLGSAIASWIAVAPDQYAYLLLAPVQVATHPWTVVTAPFVHLDWGPLLYSLVALAWFGPPVARVLGARWKFVVLYAGALLAGSAVAIGAAGPLGLSQLYVYGAGAGSVALMVAWSRFVSPDPVLPQVRWLVPKRLALLVLVADGLLSLSGLVDWAFHVHVVGVLFGLVMPAQSRPDNVVDLFPQGGQDVWH
jgi:Zn-dependent protease/membrane associated rhomboid family serine protease